MKKILIVDDEELITKVLAVRLSNLGYKVETAYDGSEGLDKALKFKPDLAIIDIGIPKIDGTTLCELIKTDEKTKHAKIIMLTGRKMVGDMEEAFRKGADLYVNKPYDFENLLEKIRKLIS